MLNRKKVLIVAHYPPPYGGISSHIRDVAQRLTIRDFSISILSFENKFKEVQINNFLKLFRVCNKISLKVSLLYFIYIMKILRIFSTLWKKKISIRYFFSSLNRSLIVNYYLKKLDINTLAVYGTETGGIIPFIKILKPDLRICFTYYAAPIKDNNFFLKYIDFWKEVFLTSDKLSSSSKYCAEGANIISKNLKPEVIYVGVELNRFKLKDDSFFLNKKIKKVLFVGRMLEEMGVKAVIEIAKKMISSRKDITFNIIGASGPLSDKVQKISEISQGKIDHKFDVSDDELNYYINSCDILIAPTVGSHACMGVSAKEALASGVPVIASNSGGLPEAIENGAEGFVVPLKNGNIDVDEFCECINHLCDNDKTRLDMGKNGRIKAEQLFSNNITEKKVSEFYTFDSNGI
ncbi:glycosyltransferase family 4 protein [Candidatus Pelagibacter sp.]|nr:glycosyltransferase family 4 protein [Candidatus Pelagibacter sp.]